MSNGFIDHTSISGALTTLALRGDKDVSVWDRQCLMGATYLLLDPDIAIAAGPGEFRGASGHFSSVVERFPTLVTKAVNKDLALRQTKDWLSKNGTQLAAIWDRTKQKPEFTNWARSLREQYWIHHVRMQGSLFNEQFLYAMSKVLDLPQAVLKDVRTRSEDEKVVFQWVKAGITSEEAKIANDAYLLAILIRGRYHENLAKCHGVHLCAHPFRQEIQHTLPSGTPELVTNTEQYFVRIIVGSALLETTPERRVNAWVENIWNAQNALINGRFGLPHAKSNSIAEACAADAAKVAGISATNLRTRRAIDLGAALVVGGLVSIVFSPWSLSSLTFVVTPTIHEVWKVARGATIGQSVTKTFVNTSARFRRLLRHAPGRIEQRFALK